MSFHQKRKNKIEHEIKAGGTDYVPPALCPRAAHASACVAAHVEHTGRPEAKEILCERSVRPVEKNKLVLRGGVA